MEQTFEMSEMKKLYVDYIMGKGFPAVFIPKAVAMVKHQDVTAFANEDFIKFEFYNFVQDSANEYAKGITGSSKFYGASRGFNRTIWKGHKLPDNTLINGPRQIDVWARDYGDQFCVDGNFVRFNRYSKKLFSFTVNRKGVHYTQDELIAIAKQMRGHERSNIPLYIAYIYGLNAEVFIKNYPTNEDDAGYMSTQRTDKRFIIEQLVDEIGFDPNSPAIRSAVYEEMLRSE